MIEVRSLAAKRRQSIAVGVSPWKSDILPYEAPKGRHKWFRQIVSPLRPFGTSIENNSEFPDLMVGAIKCRPFGTENAQIQSAHARDTVDSLARASG